MREKLFTKLAEKECVQLQILEVTVKISRSLVGSKHTVRLMIVEKFAFVGDCTVYSCGNEALLQGRRCRACQLDREDAFPVTPTLQDQPTH